MSAGKTAVVLGATSNMAFALANALMSFVKHNQDALDYDVVIYHDGLAEEDKEALNGITPCLFKKYAFPGDISQISSVFLNRYTPLMFARYEGFKLLEEYESFFWTDIDVLFQGDISEIIGWASLQGLGLCPARDVNRSNFIKPVPGYDMFRRLFNSGFLVASRALGRWAAIYDWLYAATVKYAAYLEWPDQGVLNLMLQEFKIDDLCVIDTDIYHRHPYEELARLRAGAPGAPAKAIHSNGPEKFWNYPAYYLGFPEWRKNHREWLARKASRRRAAPGRPLVSALMPTLNAEKYVGQAVRSVLEQSLENFELLVLDGGSSDATLEIVESFGDSRIRVIHDRSGRKGLAPSLNLGLSEARGRYIARMDADDIALPIKYQEQVEFLEARPEIALSCTMAQAFGESASLLWTAGAHEQFASQLIFCTPIVHPSVMWRKDDFERSGLKYDENFAANEDFELWQRAEEAVKFSSIAKPLLMYRIHGGQGSRGASTRETQLRLMERVFARHGLHLSRMALLLLDQRDHSAAMTDEGLKEAFREVCGAFIKFSRNGDARRKYGRQNLALALAAHNRWIFQTRLNPRRLGGALYIRALLAILGPASGWRLLAVKSRPLIGGYGSLLKNLYLYVREYKAGRLAQALFMNPAVSARKIFGLCKKFIRRLLNKGPEGQSRDLEEWVVWNRAETCFRSAPESGNQTAANFERYRQSSPLTKLQVGAGANHIPGWFNTDIETNKAGGGGGEIFYLDALKELPFAGATVDYIFTEHNIEHFTTEEACFMFGEFLRVLKPGGALRLATPDLRNLIAFYQEDSDLHRRYADMQFNNWMKPLAALGIHEKAFVLNDFYRNWGHKVIYDFDSLKALLASAGFSRITKCEIGESEDENLRNLERHGGNEETSVLSDEFNRLETMVLEARK